MDVEIKLKKLKNVEEILDLDVKDFKTSVYIPMKRKYAGKKVKVIIYD